MIARLLQLPVVLAALVLTMLFAPPGSLAAAAAPNAVDASSSRSGCAACRSHAPAGSPAADPCMTRPRVIDYLYPSGSLSWESCSRRPDYQLAPNDSVAVRVCCI